MVLFTHVVDEDVRRCAFLAGEVPEQALTWNLSDEVLSWIFERGMNPLAVQLLLKR